MNLEYSADVINVGSCCKAEGGGRDSMPKRKRTSSIRRARKRAGGGGGQTLRRAVAQGKSLLKRYPREVARQWRRVKESVESGSAGGSKIWTLKEARGQAAWRERAESRSALAAMWLGHASVLLRINGTNVLTDPVFSQRIGLRLGRLTVGPERIMAAPMGLEEMPRIDLILISHAHFDHLDRPTLKALASRHTTVITARGTRRLIPRGFGHVEMVDWDQELSIRGVRVRGIAAEHKGGRLGIDAHRRSNAYLMESGGRRVLFGGDTARTSAFKGLAGVDLAMLGIGAYAPRVHAHATPEQVWRMFRQTRGRTLLPMHHSTFILSDEHPEEPMQRLLKAAGSESFRVICRKVGEVWVDEGESGVQQAVREN